ncbi:MAG: transposase [Pseudomonadota bacterium]
MDEQPKQLIDEVRVLVLARPDEAAKEDFEYVRQGTCVAWMFVEPLAGWRTTAVSAGRTAVDWAQRVKAVVDDPRYAQAERITLVRDPLNTHRLASLYAAFAQEQARHLARRLELVHTSKYGSGLNMAEPELSVLTRQCLGQRLGCQQQVEARAAARNRRQTGIDWHFRTAQARVKLKYLYPT